MFSIAALSFVTPWVLLSLFLLPIIWWLIRITPPSPKKIYFPGINFLRDIIPDKETTVHTPLWLLIFRMLIIALIIIGLAKPIINAEDNFPASSGSIIILIDNGWKSAQTWNARQDKALSLIDRIERDDRSVIIIPTAAPNDNAGITKLYGEFIPKDARLFIQKLQPQAWDKDLNSVVNDVILKMDNDKSHYSIWISDGFRDSNNQDSASKLLEKLQAMGGLAVVSDDKLNSPFILYPPELNDGDYKLKIKSHYPQLINRDLSLLLYGVDGEALSLNKFTFEKGKRSQEIELKLLPEIRNQVTKISLQNYRSSASTILLDDSWRRKSVGILSANLKIKNENYLSDIFYLTKALKPFSDLYIGDIDEVFAKNLSVIILPDSYQLTGFERDELDNWVMNGGILIRFAGVNLSSEADELLPVRLRGSDRSLSGTMTWTEPVKISEFTKQSPFKFVKIPEDVEIKRQVLAEPAMDLSEKTWAKLKDGTPLITASNHGNGRMVLIHTTADTSWSNFCLSGAFVEILKNIVEISSGNSNLEKAEILKPYKILDGFGNLTDTVSDSLPIDFREMDKVKISPKTPAGLYGDSNLSFAINMSQNLRSLKEFPDLPSNVDILEFDDNSEIDIKPYLLGLALFLIIIDSLLSLFLRGFLTSKFIGVLLIGFLIFGSNSAVASDDIVKLATQMHIGYIKTGDASIDKMSKLGLETLAQIAIRRSALDIKGVKAIDPNIDELSFYPIIYWAITTKQKELDEAGVKNIRNYLNNGGMILFDTRDQQFGGKDNYNNIGASHLKYLTRGMNLPSLTEIPKKHVLTKAFYLLKDFPGLYNNGKLWIEQPNSAVNDGVPSVLIGSNDWASAWASDENGIIKEMPSGNERQREMSYRFGINLLMMALTGNYKADQVHMKHIIKRLGSK